MARTMSVGQREAFLAEVRVGVLSVAASDGRPPLTLPIWYSYEPGGELTVLTGPEARKTRLIREAGRFSLCAQQEQGMYRYVSVEGSVTGIRPVTEDDRFAMAERYLGAELARTYVAATDEGQRGNVAIGMRPDRWHTADFSDLREELS